MKKLLITLLVAGAATVAQAQISAGTMFIGGTLGFSSSSGTIKTTSGSTTTEVDLPKTTTGTIGPRFGYFIMDDLAVGIGVTYSMNKTVAEDPSPTIDEMTSTTTSTNIYLFARKYFWLGGTDNFGMYGGLNLGTTPGKEELEVVSGSTTTTTTTDNSGFNVNLNGGLTWFPSTRWGLEAGVGILGFQTSKSKTDDTEVNNNNFDFLLNSANITFGFNYYFNR